MKCERMNSQWDTQKYLGSGASRALREETGQVTYPSIDHQLCVKRDYSSVPITVPSWLGGALYSQAFLASV